MSDVEDVRRSRRGWRIAGITIVVVVLIGAVGAVVAQRGDGARAAAKVSVGAVPLPPDETVVAVSVAVEGGGTTFVKNVQGLTITPKGPGTDLRLGRGLTNDTFFTDWVHELRTQGKAGARHNLTLSLLDATFAVLKTYKVTNAVPVSVTLSPIDGTSTPQETLTLAYDRIEPA